MQKLFAELYKINRTAQNSYLMNMLLLVPIKRRRNGSYDSPNESKRQVTAYYQVPNENSTLVKVCKKTFMYIYQISGKVIQNLILRKQKGDISYVDKRTRRVGNKYNEHHRKCIHIYVNQIPRDVSHYGRNKSNKEYLSPDLNVHRLWRGYNEHNPLNTVSYRYFSRLFEKDFKNLSFHRPRSDTCKICDELDCLIEAKTSDSHRAKIELLAHHKKYKTALKNMKDDIDASVLPACEFSVISIDLEQVLFVPTLSHSDMFYKRQLACYNFCVHVSDCNKGYMCMWDESVMKRGGSEIASCVLNVLNKGILYRNKLVIWSDNCAGQNKNRMMILLMIFLVRTTKMFEEITHKFLSPGHSFLSCDRDFAVIEQRKRKTKAFVPSDLHKIVESARINNPFVVVPMSEEVFFDFHSAADKFIDTRKLQISKVKYIRVRRDDLPYIYVRNSFSDLDVWQRCNILKKGVTLTDLDKIELHAKQTGSALLDAKKADLKSMIPFLKSEDHKNFYRNLTS